MVAVLDGKSVAYPTSSRGCSVGPIGPMSSSTRFTRKEQSLDGGCEDPEKGKRKQFTSLILNHIIPKCFPYKLLYKAWNQSAKSYEPSPNRNVVRHPRNPTRLTLRNSIQFSIIMFVVRSTPALVNVS